MNEDIEKKLDQLLDGMPKPQYDLDAWLTEDETATFDSIVSRQRRPRTILRWVSVAACLLFIIGIGIKMLPEEEHKNVAQMAATAVQPKVEEAMPEEPKVEDIKAEPAKPVAAKPRKAKSITPAAVQKPLMAQESATAKNVEPEVAVVTAALVPQTRKPNTNAQPEMLTERDIPITRPENYKYTPEEMALMKKQARDAYLKWVELELEIAKHCQEQTANNYKEL